MTHFRHWFRAAPFALASGALYFAACSDGGEVDNPNAGSGGATSTTGLGTPSTSGGSTTGGTTTSPGPVTSGSTSASATTGSTSSTTTGSGGADTTNTTGLATNTSSVADSTTGMGGANSSNTTNADSTSGMGGATGMGGTTSDDAGDSTEGSTTTGGAGIDDLNSGENTMGWIGCSMGENTAIGYKRIGGTRMWGSNGNGGAVVQQFTDTNSAGWQRFDSAANQYGKPVAVWIMICIFAQAGATAQEVNQMIENAREHSAPGVVIYLTGQPLYFEGHTCTLAGTGGPESTDQLAQEVAAQHDDVIYPGSFILQDGEVQSDSCHANSQGEDSLGRQAKAFWGQPD